MGFFDRFRSNKGKATSTGPKAKVKTADETKKQLFANVSSGQKPPEEAKKPAAGKEGKETKTAPQIKESTGQAYRLLLRPVVTEKSSSVKGQYTFEVPVDASKTDVRHAVYHAYGVQPAAIAISRRDGKYVRYGRAEGRTIKRKKAIVTLPAGKSIEVFSA